MDDRTGMRSRGRPEGLRGQRRVLALVALCLPLVVAEAASWPLARYLADRAVLYVAAPSDDYSSYLSRRDPRLGWPFPDQIPGNGRDASGSRVVPAFPDPDAARSCVSLYGDSFTWSSDVSDEDAWGNELSRRLGCRVANFGVGGYGTDQALIRFRQQADDSPIVLLGFQPENVLRNVNQWRYLLYDSPLSFKPRFTLDSGGELSEVPIPAIEPSRYDDFVRHPGRYLHHEYFLPGGPSGLVALRFPRTWAVIRTSRHFHVRAKLRGEPWYAAFYDAAHDSRALDVTAAILQAFSVEAEARGKAALVVILPNEHDLEFRLETGRWTYQHLLRRLSSLGVPAVDLGPALARRAGGGNGRGLFGPTGHYNEAGCEVVAELVEPHVRALRTALAAPGRATR